jgi:hypothetical protein
VTQFGFDTAAIKLAAANDHDGKVGGTPLSAGRPTLVTLESGIQALIEIVGFTYVEGVPVAVGGQLAEDIDPGQLLERGPDGIRLKGVSNAIQAGPNGVESGHYSGPLKGRSD